MTTHTKKLYYDDPTLQKATAHIVAIEGDKVITDQTILYAEGGGQLGDQGSLGPLRVRDTQKRGGVIMARPGLPVVPVNTEVVHLVEGDTSFLAPSDEVELTVDWERRWGCTKLHSATHLVMARLQQMFPDERFITDGCLIGPTQARIDFFTRQKLGGAVLEDLQGGVDDWITTDAPVERILVPDVPEMFLWHVDPSVSPYLHMPCGGTHTPRLGAIGKVRLKRRGLGKGMERIYIFPAEVGEDQI